MKFPFVCFRGLFSGGGGLQRAGCLSWLKKFMVGFPYINSPFIAQFGEIGRYFLGRCSRKGYPRCLLLK